MEVIETFYIETEQELKLFCERLTGTHSIGLDTEFLRERTYYAQPCLLQVSAKGLIGCIDPLAIDDLESLHRLLFDTDIIKLMHACRQDLEILLQLFDGIPGPVFDTQLAAAFCGYGDQVSYAALVEEIAGISLAKAHTRARWCQRPLSEAEIHYAEDDVRYLADLYAVLAAGLDKKGRMDWFVAEMKRLLDPSGFEISNDTAWKRIGAIRSLGGRSLAIAKRLASWREDTARSRDKPRRWIMADQLLVTLAQQQPADMQALAAKEGVTDGLLKHRGRQILSVIAETGSDDTESTQPLDNRPDARQKALSKQLAKLLDDRAGQLGIPSSLLAARRELMAMVQGERSLAVLQGWRAEVIGDVLLQQVEKSTSSSSIVG